MVLRIAILSLLLVYLAKPAAAQADSLKSDLAFFRNIINGKYPSLGRFTPAERINELFDSCYAAITEQTTKMEFLKMNKLLVSALQDGHLYCGPSPMLRQYLETKALFFPLRLQFYEDNAYILRSNDSSVQAGAEVISINGKPINEIKEELFKYIVSDGAIRAGKYHVLNNVFYFYYYLAYGEQENFELAYRVKNTVKTIKISAVQASGVLAPPAPQHPGPLGFYMHNDIAVLTVRTFSFSDLEQAKEDLPAFLSKAFKTISEKKVNKLVIDLRGNGGGRDAYGALLYSYLTDKPFKYYSSLSTLVRRDASGPVYRQLEPSGHPNLLPVQPSNHNYKGAVWFLVNGLSFSATTEFCAIASYHRRGKFVGEETGGTYCGNTSGTMIDTTMPCTQFRLSVPTVKYEMAVDITSNKDRGIIPDYIRLPTVQEINYRQDPQLAYALELAGR
jgi:hypothetical protein